MMKTLTNVSLVFQMTILSWTIRHLKSMITPLPPHVWSVKTQSMYPVTGELWVWVLSYSVHLSHIHQHHLSFFSLYPQPAPGLMSASYLTIEIFLAAVTVNSSVPLAPFILWISWCNWLDNDLKVDIRTPLSKARSLHPEEVIKS